MNGGRIALLATAINLALVGVSAARRGSETGFQGPVLRGRALELVDQHGTIRARLNVEPGGAVVLRMTDARGTIRVKLGADADGSGLLLANDATEPGIHLLAQGKGSSIRLANQDGRERLISP